MTKQVDRMWPTLLDMSRDECKRVLRRLELEAYSSFVSALRAQGDLSKEKKHLLEELCRVLSISSERHRAEVRRAVNDERLATIADCTSGPSTSSEWSVEGRRLVPILPRLVPQTAFTSIANSAANVAAAHNALLSQRHQSSGKPEAGMSQMAMNNNVPTSSPSPIGSTSPRSASPTSNVVVLPSGMSIQVKEDGEETVRKRRRASSFTESIVAITKVSTGTVTKPMSSQVPASTALMRSAAANTSVLSSSASMPSLTPMKITLTKSPTKPTIVTTTSGQTQKVILVSNSNTPNSVIHRSFSVPSSTVVKTTPAAAAGHVRPVSALTAASLPTIPGSVVTMSVTGTSSTTAYVTNAISVSRPWPKTMPLRPATPPSSAHKLGLGRPAGVVSVSGGAPTVAQPVTRTVQMRTVGKPGAMQMKNDAGVKIITQTIPTSNIATGQSRILPKPTSYTTASASGGVAQTAARVINVVTSQIPRVSSCVSGGGVAGGRSVGSVLTVSPKTMQTTAGTVKVYTPTGAFGKTGVAGTKPSVIVVQKAAGSRQGTVLASRRPATTVYDKGSNYSIETVGSGQSRQTRVRVVQTTAAELSQAQQQAGLVASQVQQQSQLGEQDSSSILADLIRAAGIVETVPPPGGVARSAGEFVDVAGGGGGGGGEESGVMNDFNESELVHAAQTASRTPGPSELQGQWIQYEMPSSGGSVLNVPAGEDGVFDPSTMTTLVELSGKERNSTTPDLLQGQYLTLEQAADLFSQGLLTSEGDEVQVISGAAVSTDQNVEPLSVHKQPLVAGQAQLYVDGSGISVAADSAGVAATELDPATGLFYPNSQQESSRLPAIAQPATSVQLVVTTLPSGGIQLQQESISSGGAALLQDPGVQLQRPAQQETAGVMAAVEAPPCDNTATVASAVQAIMTTRDAAVVVQTTAGAGESSDAGRRLSAGDGAPSRHGNLMSELTGLGAIVTGAGTNAGRAPQVADAKSRLTTVTALAQADVFAMPAMSTQLVMGEPAGTSVTVISSGLDTSSMNVEDFTSQRLAETEYFAVSDTKKVGYALPAELISRTRKRKMDEGSQGSVSGGSWVRAAMGLLEKVSRYRGVGRMKGELNAADWFNKPVDLSEAPEYLKIIKTPMDFSTIRNKLKAGQYGNFDEFHADMLLVKTNCQLYNPSDHDARKDCDEVFQFYAQEYNKLMEKWQTSHLMSPSKVPSMSKI